MKKEKKDQNPTEWYPDACFRAVRTQLHRYEKEKKGPKPNRVVSRRLFQGCSNPASPILRKKKRTKTQPSGIPTLVSGLFEPCFTDIKKEKKDQNPTEWYPDACFRAVRTLLHRY